VAGSRNHDVGLYHSLILIFSAPTETKSHDASVFCSLRFGSNGRQLDLGEQ
jgi:hypothetical protein